MYFVPDDNFQIQHDLDCMMGGHDRHEIKYCAAIRLEFFDWIRNLLKFFLLTRVPIADRQPKSAPAGTADPTASLAQGS